MRINSRVRITDPRPARVLGGITMLYSAAILIAPKILAKPCGMTTSTGEVPSWVPLLIRAIGVRDTVSGLAMLLTRPGRGLQTACLARAAADAGDAVLFGTVLTTPAARLKIGGFAAIWALANLAAAGRAGS